MVKLTVILLFLVMAQFGWKVNRLVGKASNSHAILVKFGQMSDPAFHKLAASEISY